MMRLKFNADVFITAFLVFVFLAFYTLICLEHTVLPTLILFLILALLPWFRLYNSILALISITLAVGFCLLTSWLEVTLDIPALYLTCNHGDFFKVQFYNDATVLEPKEHAHEDLIPAYEEVASTNDGEKVLAICLEQQEASLQLRNYIYWLHADMSKFLPYSQKYLAKHYLDLSILKSTTLEQYYGDLRSPFLSAHTHSNSERYGNTIVSSTDFDGFQRFQYKTEWTHFNPSYLKYVTRVGHVDFDKSLNV